MSVTTADAAPPRSDPGHRRLVWIVVITVVVLVGAILILHYVAARSVNHVALSAAPKPVTVVRAAAAEYQPLREYVGVTEPWNAAKVGPQYVSAYVGSVRFRPGAEVKRGEVLATLDCRSPSAGSRAIAARARAIRRRQTAQADEATRVQQIAAGGFASQNEVEQLRARAAAEREEIDSVQENLAGKNLEVDDCVLRAPFDGDVVGRFVDPGAYVRPGDAVLTVADRATLRVTGDAPESDFDALAPGTPVAIELESIASLRLPIARRTPATEPSTRTIHFEIDVPNRERRLPTGTTARLRVAVGAPRRATTLPLQAATLRQRQATLFVLDGDVARRKVVPILGQREGTLYLDPSLPAGAEVVLEGRSLLQDGDRVRASPAS